MDAGERERSARAMLKIAVVGGLSRATHLWVRAGDQLGVRLEHHDGRVAGRGVAEITAIVRRADVVVIITEPNSHGGVAAARRAATLTERPHVLVKRLRPDGLAAVIGDSFAQTRAAS